MAITVLFFASLREQVGSDSVAVSSDGANDLDGLLRTLKRMLGAEALAALTAPDVRVAVNREFVGQDVQLSDGDEVAFMPPITGG